jgi:hypothetical protein
LSTTLVLEHLGDLVILLLLVLRNEVLAFVSPPVLMTCEAEHPLKSSMATAALASATCFIVAFLA